MGFASISALVNTGPGIAPQYESFGPVSREELNESEVAMLDELLEEANFRNETTSAIVKAARDMPLTSISVTFEDNSQNSVKYMNGSLPSALEQVLKFITRKHLER